MSQSLMGRVQALADANALVRRTFSDVETAAKAVDLKDLIEKVLAPHHSITDESRPSPFHVEGPPIQLGERATSAFALVCHELATNAAKYGALHESRGTLHILWEEQEPGLLNIIWRERGGPIIKIPPTKNGFGSVLAKQTVINQFHGSLAYDWQPQGLSVTISVPVKNLLT